MTTKYVLDSSRICAIIGKGISIALTKSSRTAKFSTLHSLRISDIHSKLAWCGCESTFSFIYELNTLTLINFSILFVISMQLVEEDNVSCRLKKELFIG